MMQVSFGLTTPPPLLELSFLSWKKKWNLIFPPLGIYVEWLRKFSFSSQVSYFRRELCCDEIEYCIDRLFVAIPQIHLNGIFWAGSYAFVGVFWSLDNTDQFANPLFDGAYFPECHVVFVDLEKNFTARIEMFLMVRDGFLELCLPWNKFIEQTGILWKTDFSEWVAPSFHVKKKFKKNEFENIVSNFANSSLQ